MSNEAVDLISRLLDKEPSRRLTSPSVLKLHPFFNPSVDFRALLSKSLKTPYKPLLDTHDDTKHFDAHTLALPVESPTGGGAQVVQECEEEYEGFTFEA